MGLLNETKSDDISARFANFMTKDEEELALHEQEIKADDNRIINNPDMGFYRSYTVKVTTNGISNMDEIIKDLKNIDNDSSFKTNFNYAKELKFSQIQLVVDISDFSGWRNIAKDVNLDERILSGLKDIFELLNENGKTVITRFDFNTAGAMTGDWIFHDAEIQFYEKTSSMIKAICNVLKPYSNVITAIECDIPSTWDDKPFMSTYVINNFCNELKDTDLPLLVRTPDFIYRCITQNTTKDIKQWYAQRYTLLNNTSYSPDKKGVYYRLGIFNDDYLKDISDNGTFKMGSYNGERLITEGEFREKEINFLIPFTNHTPYGGQIKGFFHIDSDAISQEMFKTHLSYLSIQDDSDILSQLAEQEYNNTDSVLSHIAKHMGYRFEIQKCFLQHPEDFSSLHILLVYQNNGFANIPYHRTKTVTILLRNKENNEVISTGEIKKFVNAESANSGTEYPEEELASYKASNLNLPNGTYEVFIKIADKTTGNYPIEFANEGIWDESLQANKVGEFEKNL